MAVAGQPKEDLSRSVVGASEVLFEYYCNPCDEEDRHVEAVGYCKNCSDYLCEECYKSHRRPRPSRHHVLLDKDSMPKDTATSRKKPVHGADKCTTFCGKHPDKVIEYYCKTHDSLECSMCAFAYHRNCKQVDHIPDVADKIVKGAEFKDALSHLQDLEKKAVGVLKSAVDNISISYQCCNEAIASVHTNIQEIISVLQTLGKELKNEANDLNSENEKRISGASAICNAALSDIKGTVEGLMILQQGGYYCNLFVSVKKAVRALPALSRDLEIAHGDIVVNEFKFEPNPEFRTSLRTYETYERFGNITISPSSDFIPELKIVCSRSANTSSVSTPYDVMSGQAGATSPVPCLIKDIKTTDMTAPSGTVCEESRCPIPYNMYKNTGIQHVTDIVVNNTIDKGCWITGVSQLPGGLLIAVDFRYRKIKVIHLRDRKLAYNLNLHHRPRDVTSVDKDKVAVTLPDVRNIQYLKVATDGTVSVDSIIRVSGTCYGITCLEDRLWVSYIQPGKIESLSMDGKVQLSISTDAKGQQIFRDPQYIALSPDRKIIYVSDNAEGSVIQLSSTGKVLSVYKEKDLHSPCGISVDENGIVYVCDLEGGHIHMLTANCKRLKLLHGEVLIKDGPYCLTFNNVLQQLFVGMLYSERIRVLRLWPKVKFSLMKTEI